MLCSQQLHLKIVYIGIFLQNLCNSDSVSTCLGSLCSSRTKGIVSICYHADQGAKASKATIPVTGVFACVNSPLDEAIENTKCRYVTKCALKIVFSLPVIKFSNFLPLMLWQALAICVSFSSNYMSQECTQVSSEWTPQYRKPLA